MRQRHQVALQLAVVLVCSMVAWSRGTPTEELDVMTVLWSQAWGSQAPDVALDTTLLPDSSGGFVVGTFQQDLAVPTVRGKTERSQLWNLTIAPLLLLLLWLFQVPTETLLGCRGLRDGYIARIDTESGRVEWAVSIGGEADDIVEAVSVVPAGVRMVPEIAVVGSFQNAATFGQVSTCMYGTWAL